MDEIIRVKNDGYSEYEELLLQRDNVRKEAHHWEMAYMQEFGDLITEVFEKKIICIKKKKMLAYCQTAANKGLQVEQAEMQAFIQKEMAEYNRQLKDMIAENDVAHSGHLISSSTANRIKKLYHKLAKILHPDINPKTEEIPELKKLWHMIVVSYNTNDLEELEAAEVLVMRALEEVGWESIEVEIANLPERIEKVKTEIIDIKGKNPYQYKFLLEDSDAVLEKKKSLQKEMQEYTDYEKELDSLMEQFLTSGVSFKWTMN